jgi:uncharacterized protein (DUF885 family)
MHGHRLLLPFIYSLVAGCSSGSNQASAPAAVTPRQGTASAGANEAARRVNAIADDYWAQWVQTFPLAAMFSGVPDAPNDKIGDNSIATVRAWEKREDRWLDQMHQIRASELNGQPEDATYGVLLETLEASKEGRVCRGELLPLNQQGGWQIGLPVVAQLQPVGTSALRSAALARWHGIPRYVDTEIVNLREGLREGYTQPRGNAQAVIDQLNDVLKLPPEKSPFAALGDRDSAPGFRDSVLAIVTKEIIPAATRYRDFLVSEYMPKARTSTALTALPHGADCYRARVRGYTTVDRDARSIHQLGLQQMAAIEAEARPIAERSFKTSDLPALYQRMRTDTALTFRSREEIINTAEAAVARAKAAMPKWFGRLPRGDVIVDPCLPFEEKSGCPNSYVPGTPDGKRPGRWRINASMSPPQPRSALEGTAFHETIPGHHLQIAIAQERESAHPITRYLFFSGFGEGWALYSERLAGEMGLYSTDLYKFGDLGEQALRAARLVVDPGLAVLGWSRQQAIDYMVAHVPESHDVLVSEIDRYIADPGQATAYMIGRLEIERLRSEAKSRLGNGFDIREFHDRVLESGSVPLSFLRSHIQAWLESKTQRASR